MHCPGLSYRREGRKCVPRGKEKQRRRIQTKDSSNLRLLDNKSQFDRDVYQEEDQGCDGLTEMKLRGVA
jgi:hypothetical protein